MKHTNIIKSTSEVTRLYEKTTGICADEGIIDPIKKLLLSENMYVDPEGSDGALESVPGFRVLHSFSSPIRAIHRQKLSTGEDYLLIHAGNKLYRFPKEEYAVLDKLDPIADLADRKSCSFSFDRSVYILDGEKIVRVNEEGVVSEIDASSEDCYIPLTYRDGIAVEERNLLSDKFRETKAVRNADECAPGSFGLVYSVTDPVNMCCEVVGASGDLTGEVFIPSFAVIEGEKYRVCSIGSNAFYGNDKISGIYVGRGVMIIKKWAFWGLTNLTRVVLSHTVEVLEDRAFYKNPRLSEVYLGIGIKSVGAYLFSGSPELKSINYAGSEESFAEIAFIDELEVETVNFNVLWSSVTVSVPITSDAEAILSVKIDGEEKDFYYDKMGSQILLKFDSRDEIDGKRVNVVGKYSQNDKSGFLSTRFGSRLSAQAAVIGSRVCQTFDGRIFLSGNPSLAGTVFYSQTTEDGTVRPDYFGSSCFFIDGEGDHTVTSLVSSRGELTVFKSGDDGSGSIFCHAPTVEGGKRVYPLTYIHGDIAPRGDVFSFEDDCVFLSDIGLIRLERRSGGSRSAVLLSEEIDPLLRRSLGEVSITKWYGYLVVAVGSDVYLGYSENRSGGGYAWYPLKDIGTHKNGTRVYRYAESAPVGFNVSDKAWDVSDGEVMSIVEDGQLIYYEKVGDDRIVLIPTEERRGGELCPHTVMVGDGKLLFFGTEGGELCVFNNDLRGKPPESIARQDEFDPSEYEASMGDRLHPEFYSFAGYAPRYALLTAEDDCGVPYLEKTTVPYSLAIRVKNLGGGFECRLKTEQGVRSLGFVTAGRASFDCVDMSRLTSVTESSSTVTLPDRSQGWIHKQICLLSEAFRSPFGVYSIAYRYKIKGRPKR